MDNEIFTFGFLKVKRVFETAFLKMQRESQDRTGDERNLLVFYAGVLRKEDPLDIGQGAKLT